MPQPAKRPSLPARALRAGPRGRGLYADAALAGLVLLIVGMMIVPLPTWLIDVLIAANLGLSILLLLTAMYVPHGIAFSSMPSLLLITTLYRLALNVSSTRLILLQADAGRVIRAFGAFVVRGDYFVGASVFAIIALIQYLVIAKGGERVAEVAARFTLDAMPGKQLAIDADLRAGALRVEAARAKRARLERESQFFGAMDGAMKFIKGDAIATLVIVLVALVAGSGIGVAVRGLSWRAALQLYGLLAIGDGLVSQLPSLVTSIAAGLVVTRVAEHEQPASLAQDLFEQLSARPRALGAASACLLGLSLVPGLPAPPFIALSALAAAFGLGVRRRARVRPSGTQHETSEPSPVLRLELGAQLAAASSGEAGRQLERELVQVAQRVTSRLGLPTPSLHIEHDAQLADDELVLQLRDAPVLRERAGSGAALAELLQARLPRLLQLRARELLGLDDVQARIDVLARHAPTLARSLSLAMPLPAFTELLRRLLDEGVSVRALARIAESLVGSDEQHPSLERSLDRVRRALRDELARARAREGVLRVHRLDPLIEDAVREAVQHAGGTDGVPLAPELARDVIAAVRVACSKSPEPPVLLTQPDIRRHVRDLLAHELPEVAVLSYPELPGALQVEEREPIAIGASG